MISVDVAGSPEARAQELIDVTTSHILSHMSTVLSADHQELLVLLLALERLQATRKLTNDEMSLWMADAVNETVQSHVQCGDDVCPHWLSHEVSSVAHLPSFCHEFTSFSYCLFYINMYNLSCMQILSYDRRQLLFRK